MMVAHKHKWRQIKKMREQKSILPLTNKDTGGLTPGCSYIVQCKHKWEKLKIETELEKIDYLKVFSIGWNEYKGALVWASSESQLGANWFWKPVSRPAFQQFSNSKGHPLKACSKTHLPENPAPVSHPILDEYGTEHQTSCSSVLITYSWIDHSWHCGRKRTKDATIACPSSHKQITEILPRPTQDKEDGTS